MNKMKIERNFEHQLNISKYRCIQVQITKIPPQIIKK